MNIRPAFLTIPRPHAQVRKGKPVKFAGRTEQDRSNIQCYLNTDDFRLVSRAAEMCQCTKSEFLRQLALNACAALGVRDDASG